MGISIRRIAVEPDRQLLIEFLRRYLTPESTELRFAWLYLANPAGQAQAWVAEDTKTKEVVGTSAVFPRCLYVDGEEARGFVLGDFCIRPEYRSLGPAVQLQRACLEQMSPEIRAMGYDLPGNSMLPVHRRLGTAPQNRLVRLAKPLRVDRKVAERIPIKVLASGLRLIGNRVLEARDLLRRKPLKDELAWHRGPFEQEFSTLAARVSANHGIATARTASFLNWRYRAHPLRQFEILTARRDGELAAYVILTHDAQDARIVDLFGIQDWELLSGLLAHAVQFLRGLNVVTVSAHVLATHPWIGLFAASGFRPRDSCPVVFYSLEPELACKGRPPTTSWFLMDGDRES